MEKTCPKCQGRMTKGHIKDWFYVGVQKQRWTKGSPAFGQEQKVDTYACEACGYLESYLEQGKGP